MTVIQLESPRRAWTRLPSGGRLDLVNPSPSAWSDSDIAIRLSRTFRWGGDSIWSEPLSVAQHCLLVLELQGSSDPRKALRELLHDADEGFIAFDCISPLKPILGKPFKDLADRLTAAIFTRYDLPEWEQSDYTLHKYADNTAAASEAFHCTGWTEEEVRNVLCIKHPILKEDPLAAVYDCRPWEPWPSKVAAERFHAKLSELLQACRNYLPAGENRQEA